VFDWVGGKKTGSIAQAHETITVSQFVDEHGVPPLLVLSELTKTRNRIAACRSLPFTVLLVFSYAFVAIGHMDAPSLRSVEQSLHHDILEKAGFALDKGDDWKNVFDVDSYTDFWSFMSIGFVPFLFHEVSNQTHMLATYNRIMGGIRLRQERLPWRVQTSRDFSFVLWEAMSAEFSSV